MTEPDKHKLVEITSLFLGMIKDADGQLVDLKQAEKQLGVPKRRLYDISNVLSSVGVIERCGKSKVKWVGNQIGTQELDMDNLIRHDQALDAQLQALDKDLLELYRSDDFRNYGWLADEDFTPIINENKCTLFALQGPPDLQLEMPNTDDGLNNTIKCSSNMGVIDMIQINTT